PVVRAAGVAEVALVGAVVAGVPGAEAAAGEPGRLVDRLDLTGVRRRGEDQVDAARAEPRDLAPRCLRVAAARAQELPAVSREQPWQLVGVAFDDAGVSGCALFACVREVGGCEACPA